MRIPQTAFLLLGLLGTTGCNVPKVFDIAPAPQRGLSATVEEVSSGSSSSSSSGSCDLLSLVGQAPARSLQEYAKLREHLQSISPSIQKDPSLLAQAHAKAIYSTCSKALSALATCGRKLPQRRKLVTACREFDRSSKPSDRLDASLETVFALSSADRGIANALLDVFYTDYVSAIDPFGSLVFGGETPSREISTIGKVPNLGKPSYMKDLALVSHYGQNQRVLRLTLTDWSEGTDIVGALDSLDGVARDLTIGAVLFDLRHAGGYDASVLSQLRESATKVHGWGELPWVIVVDSATYGYASIFASQALQRQKTEIWGYDSMTYGYGRKLVNSMVTWIDGLTPAQLTVGGVLLNPDGETYSDGAMVRVGEGYRLASPAQLDEALKRAELLASQVARKTIEDQPAIESAEIVAPQPESTTDPIEAPVVLPSQE